MMLNRPSREEYHAVFEKYVSLVPEGDIREILAQSLKNTTDVLSSITEEHANYRYAEGKWSLKEVLGHINDSERIMSYRVLRIARGDKTPLAGFDENLFINGASFDQIPMKDLMEDYSIARQSTLSLIRGFSEEAWTRTGIVIDYESTARAWAYILAGHEIHHLNIIKGRYLN